MMLCNSTAYLLDARLIERHNETAIFDGKSSMGIDQRLLVSHGRIWLEHAYEHERQIEPDGDWQAYDD